MSDPGQPDLTAVDLPALELDLEIADTPPQSPTRIFWRQIRKSPLAIAGGLVLALFYLLAILAPFVAPYSQEEMDRQRYFHPPHRLHWIGADGRLHLRPFVLETRLGDPGAFRYDEVPAREYPIRFFVAGAPFTIAGIIPGSTHLFGVDAPGRLYLMGTDSFGR